MKKKIRFFKILIFPLTFLFLFFFFTPIVLPGSASHQIRQLDGITLIATRSRSDLSLGLQYVTKMPENVGVLFRDLGRHDNAFHCHNCLFTIEMTALDKNGKILKIVDAPPETDRVKMPEGTGSVIETNADVMRHKGFRVGDKIELSSLKKSIDPSLNVEDDLPRSQAVK
jgi:uncharacterized membrane protein (UPF0127 family)